MLVRPCFQIRSSSIVEYTRNVEREYSNFRTDKQIENDKRFTEKYQPFGLHVRDMMPRYTGELTQGVKKRLTKTIETFILCTKEKTIYSQKLKRRVRYRINFISLTFHATDEIITASEATVLCLEPFLKHLRQVYGVVNYIWKAEYQKRGQLHYHIITDRFIPWQAIRAKWNELQERAGYMESYKAEYGNNNPNSTDVHAFTKQQAITSYIKKEIIKSYQNEESVNGKVWDCSTTLKSANYFTVEDLNFDFNRKLYFDQKKPYKERKIRNTFTGENYKIHYLNEYNNSKTIDFLSENELKDFNDTINSVLNYQRKPPTKKEPPPERTYEPYLYFKPQITLF